MNVVRQITPSLGSLLRANFSMHSPVRTIGTDRLIFSLQNVSHGLASRCLSSSFQLDEGDLNEVFVRGSGPGGQSVNKTRNNVQLTHLPTGITVHCHETRELNQNRRIARKLLRDKIELALHGEDSKLGRKYAKERQRKRKAKQ